MAVAMLAGAVVRGLHLLLVDVSLPFAKGGLFAAFAREIAAGGYRLPATIPHYSAGGVPYAYPPLPFYLQAVLVHGLQLPPFPVANLLPVGLAVLTLPSFWLLLRQLDWPDQRRLAALFAYALMPGAYLELVESQGLAEVWGALTLLWLAAAWWRWRRQQSATAFAGIGLCWGVCVLAAPGSALGAALLMAVLGVAGLGQAATGRSRLRAAGLWLLAAGTAVAVSAVYWWPVLRQHGPDIFLGSLGGQARAGGGLLDLIIGWGNFRVAAPYLPFLWDATIFLGLIWALLRRHGWLVAWFILFWLVPGEGAWLVSLPAALLAGSGVTEGWRPLLARWRSSGAPTIRAWAGRLLLAAGVAAYLLLAAGFNLFLLLAGTDGAGWPDGVQAAAWLQQQTPPDARLVVLADERVREWIPYLARRTVLNVPEGLEWAPAREAAVLAFNDRLAACADAACAAGVIATAGEDVAGPPAAGGPAWLLVERARWAEWGQAAYTGGEGSVVWEGRALLVVRLALPAGDG